MKHKIWYDEQNKILMLKVIGEYSTQDAVELAKSYNALLEGSPYRQLIVDLSNAGSMESRKTRKIQNELLNNAGIIDIAFVGSTAATRMIARVMMKLGSLNASSNFVETVPKAVYWLKRQRGS